MAMCTPFVVLGIFLLGKSPLVGWLSIGFFGLAYPIGIYNLLDKRPAIILNELGIFDRSIHKEFINWELIKDAYPMSIKSQKFICLVVDEKFKPSKKKGVFYKSLSTLNEALGAQELNINLNQVQKMDEVKLTQFILKMSKATKTDKTMLLKELEMS
jgi:hypothetical protein